MVHYRRAKTPGACYFLTLTLRNRASNLLVRHHAQLGNALRLVRQQKPYRLPAIVLLPDHLHMLMQLPMTTPTFLRESGYSKPPLSASCVLRALKV